MLLTRSPLARRALAIVASFVLVFGIAACEDGPTAVGRDGIGLAESDTAEGFFGFDTSTSGFGFTANRTGRVTVRACGPTDANFDAAIITRSRDTTIPRPNSDTGTVRVRIADTVTRASATTSGCEDLTADVVQGQTYRIVVRTVTGFGSYAVCYAYDGAECTALPARAAYYAAAEGKSGAALITALHDIVRVRHNGFLYDTARGHLYENVEDPDDDNRIEDVYAGRVETVTMRFSDTVSTDAGDVSFSAEHAWPQSCGSRLDQGTGGQRARGPRGDLHIVFASDKAANEQGRLNDPYGIVSGTATASYGPDSAGQFSRRGSNGTLTVFEPRNERKGDLARAIFYYYVRYVPEIPTQTSLRNFILEQPVLLQWAQQDPPDAFERARNDEVFRVQGNRNPFVDRPEFLAAIGTFPTDVAGVRATCNF